VRRLVTEPAAYLSELARTAIQAWNTFFFRPSDPTPLGLMRVCVGLLVLWSMAVYGIDLADFFGSAGWADPGALEIVQGRSMPYAWSFWSWVPDSLLRAVWIACLLVLGLYTLGLWSRVTAVLAWVIVVSTVRRAPISLFGFDQITSTLTLYLAVTGASGQAVSIDRFLARWKQARALTVRRLKDGRWPLEVGMPRPTISANLALRLIQLHFCLIYGMAGLAKLQGPGWWNGTAIWGLLASGEFNLLDFTWLAAHPLLLNVMTHASLAIEISYPILIWPIRIRPLTLAIVVLLHLGIGLTAPGLAEFGLAMCAGNLAFVSGPWLRSLVVGQDRSKPGAIVIYDGACPRCRASIAFVTSADPDHLIEPVDLTSVDVRSIHPSLSPEACLKAMHVVRADGRVVSGFDAVIALGRLIPPFWLPSLAGSLPGVSELGRRVYQRIADSRPRDVPCTDDVCSLHPRSSRARIQEKSSQQAGVTLTSQPTSPSASADRKR
jgi:predicted DCC family thiol-disulfide oxidoreductase YuxK